MRSSHRGRPGPSDRAATGWSAPGGPPGASRHPGWSPPAIDRTLPARPRLSMAGQQLPSGTGNHWSFRLNVTAGRLVWEHPAPCRPTAGPAGRGAQLRLLLVPKVRVTASGSRQAATDRC